MEYYAVILHFTPRSFRLGFAGEPEPVVDLTPNSLLWKRCVSNISTERQYPRFLETESHSLDSNNKTEIVDAIELLPELSMMVKNFNIDYNENRWTNWHQNHYRDLGRLLKHCISHEMLISPSLCKLFIIDGGLLAVEKYQVCHSMLAQKKCAAVSFLPRSVLCAVSASIEDATVIHIDWNECNVSILSDLRSILEKSYRDYTLETVHYNFAVGTSGFDAIEALVRAPLHREQLEELKTDHPINLILSGLPEEVARVILALDIDTRPKVAKNIVFLGAVSGIPGFKAVFITQLRKHLSTLTVSGKQCLGAWTGASLYCLTTLLRQEKTKWKHKEVSRDKLDTEAWKEFMETCIH